MGFYARVARVPAGQVPDVQWKVQANGAVFKIGAFLFATVGVMNECGVDPALIAGIALQAADTGLGWAPANNPTVITGRQQKVSMAMANRVTIFQAPLTNGSAVNINAADADVLVAPGYGLTAYAGEWTVDKAKVGAAARVKVLGFDNTVNAGLGVVFFKVLEANLQ